MSMARASASATESRVLALSQRLGDVEKATLTTEVPRAFDDYLYELKYDGYRFLAIKSGASVRLVSRKGHDWGAKFPSVVEAVARLAPRELVLDGEVCALDERGVPSFNRLQNASAGSNIVYVVFDLLWLDGADLRTRPLEGRRAELEGVMRSTADRRVLALSSAVRAEPSEVLAFACEHGFEGIVAKRRASTYVSGRTRDWLKIKCTHRQEFAIIGYLPYLGTEDAVGALLLALHDDDGFRYAGKVGTGFTEAKRRALAEDLEPDRIPRTSVRGAPRVRIARWVRPRLVAEVAFSEWTPGGSPRHPSFQGLRIDKSPEECVREVPSLLSEPAAPKPAPKRSPM